MHYLPSKASLLAGVVSCVTACAKAAWRISDPSKTAVLILNATSRFHHTAMVALHGAETDPKQWTRSAIY